MADKIAKLMACVGAIVMALFLAGAVGIGHFRLVYSGNPITCTIAGDKP